MNSSEYQSVLISGAENTVSHGTLWIPLPDGSSLLVYCMHNLISICDVSQSRVICTLRDHDQRINALAYTISYIEGIIEIFSGSNDKTLRVWRHSLSSQNPCDWTVSNSLTGFDTSVNTISAISIGGATIVAGADSSGSIIIWLRSQQKGSEEFLETQRISMPSAQIAHNLYFSALPTESSSYVSLFTGNVDSRIHMYFAKVTDGSEQSVLFSPIGILSGHEEWVTCLCAALEDDYTLFVASGSQDCKIRVWKVTIQQIEGRDREVSTALQAKGTIALSDEEAEDEHDVPEGEVIPNKNFIEEDHDTEARFRYLTDSGGMVAVYLESLLIGHEDWVTSVHWMPKKCISEKTRLFSTSMDRNMVLWTADETIGGVWSPIVRVGDIGGSLGGSIGGNLLGFVGGCISPNGFAMMGVGFGGSFHLWVKKPETEEEEEWNPLPFLSGHFDSVNDIVWSQDNNYLISASSDQTCRMFAALKPSVVQQTLLAFRNVNGMPLLDRQMPTHGTQLWREISRPQIHGYDLNCIRISPSFSSYFLYSGGEEKLIRVFDAPTVVIEGLAELCGVETSSSMVTESEVSTEVKRIDRAYMPELGLSNKAMETMSSSERKEQEARRVGLIDWSQPLLEAQLADYTLWPEMKKLFGHNNEIVSMDMSHDGSFLATAAKARDANSAGILLWATQNQELKCKLGGHESTLVSLKFSPNDSYLASGGKDRILCVYRRDSNRDAPSPYLLHGMKRNAHKRIIWDCSWTGDSSLLITVSRDGSAKVWRIQEYDSSQDAGIIELVCANTFGLFQSASITAVDVFISSVIRRADEDYWLVVFGADKGDMQIVLLSVDASRYIEYFTIPSHFSHGSTVKRVKWQLRQFHGDGCLLYASCGADNSVRIHSIKI